MDFLHNTWLYRMWQTDRKLLAMVALYIGGTIWFALRQHEEFPFLLYGMYSLKEEPKETYTTYAIRIDGKEVRYTATWDLEKEMITAPLLHAVSDFENGKLTKEQMQQLYGWLFRYIADMRMIEDNTLKIDKLTCTYNADGSVQIVKREAIADYAAD